MSLTSSHPCVACSLSSSHKCLLGRYNSDNHYDYYENGAFATSVSYIVFSAVLDDSFDVSLKTDSYVFVILCRFCYF
jgi:hypothetical protein